MTLNDYKFPGVPKPFEHQIETTKFIVENERCFVLNDIGTGKTWSAVWAIDYLMQTGKIRNVLIIAPVSTLEIVWARTFFHLNNHDIMTTVLTGTAAKKNAQFGMQQFVSKYKVSIVNPESLHIIADNPYLSEYDMILVDESAGFRNATRNKCKTLAKICQKIPRVVMQTGSPTPEAPTDIWATARIIAPKRVPRFFGQFRDITMRKTSQFKWTALPEAAEIIANALKGFVIRYERDECIDLPESLHHTLELEPTRQQTKMIREMRKFAVSEYEDNTVSAPNEAVVISKILQIASGAVKFADGDDSGVIDVDCKSKFDALQDILTASTQPVIVFAPFKAAIRKIADFFSGKIPYSVVSGDTPASERMQVFDSLQSGMIRLLIAHPEAMSHGISLTHSNVIVWWTPVYSHETYEQANGRITRPGQIRNQYVIHLTCSALEQKVISKLEGKSQLQGTLLEYLQRQSI